MLARDVITLFQQRMGGHLNRNALLAEIKMAQNEILCLPDIDLLKNKTDVYLTTTAGTREYTLASPVRVVTRVFTRNSSIGGWGDRYRARSNGSDVQETDLSFSCKEANDASDTCVIYLPPSMDPGDTTDVFLLEQYSWPVPLTSESIEMSLPAHWITTLLYYAVKKRVEESQYGVDIYNSPEFKALMQGFQSHSLNSPTQVQQTRQVRF